MSSALRCSIPSRWRWLKDIPWLRLVGRLIEAGVRVGKVAPKEIFGLRREFIWQDEERKLHRGVLISLAWD